MRRNDGEFFAIFGFSTFNRANSATRHRGTLSDFVRGNRRSGSNAPTRQYFERAQP